MRVQDTLQELSEKVSSDELSDLSKEQLKRYSSALCFSAARGYFSTDQFSQVCETIRLLLLKEYTEETNKKYIRLQYIVIALAIFSLIGTGTQVYLAISKSTQPIVETQPRTKTGESKTTVIRAPR